MKLWLLILLLLSVNAEETTTLTHTNYITPAWFMNAINTALVNNPDNQNDGIKVVFIDGVDQVAQSPTITSSFVYYPVSTSSVQINTVTNCQDGTCITQTSSETVPYIYSTSAYTFFTSLGDESRSKQRQTIYETHTDNSIVNKLITKSASTTTKTIFSAVTTPTTVFKPTTSDVSVIMTQKNPLVTGEVVSKSQSFSIKSHFTDPITFSQSLNSTFPGSNSSNANSAFTSTIDLRISSTSRSALPTAGAKLFSNSSSFAGSNFKSSSLQLVPVSSLLSSSVVPTIAKLATTTSGSETSPTASAAQSSSEISQSLDSNDVSDLFQAIDTSSPPSIFPRQELPLNPADGVANDGPYQTNKFFTNLILSDGQEDMIWSYPYGLSYKNSDYYGFGIQQTNISNRVFGPKSKNTDGDSYFFNPTGNFEVIISGDNLGKGNNNIGITNQKFMSTTVTLSSTSTISDDYIEIPVVQGMGFVTSIYHGTVTPEFNTLIGFSAILQEQSDALLANVLKYRLSLFNGVEYLMYVILPDGASFDLKVIDSFHIAGTKAIDGLVVQLAVAPGDSSNDAYYDEAAGAYPTSVLLAGSASGSTAEYSFNYNVNGTSSSGNTIIFALPHHISSLSSETSSKKTPITLLSTTKGEMSAFLTNKLTLQETLNQNVDFLPWSPLMTNGLSYSADQLSLLASVAQSELNVDISLTVAGMDSNYFSGKVLDKYANILLVVNDILQDKDSAKDILADLKSAFEVFTSNTQFYPLMYDTKFKGITSTASQNGDTGADFGSGYYNDHHFHNGYFVHAAAVIGYVDSKLGGTWAQDNKEWVNSLIRDVANPSESDSYFPVSRMFDWYAGHSWAGGLFASGDGRNEESSSEDYHFSYGMKLWGKVIGDQAMQSRGDLMLAIMNRAMNDYFLYSDNNDVVPQEMIPNKISGIFFDNKIAFTTYFGDADTFPQYVHGIHMIPMTAASALIRGTDYVNQEWNTCITKFVDNLSDGWAGIIRLNQALIDPQSSYEFFSSSDFKSTYLDNGQSRTWSLAFSGGIANSS